MNILLLSPYDAASHRYWHQGLMHHLREQHITLVTLPPRYFSWRFRGNSLSLAFDPRLAGDWDLLLATSMTDLSALRGMRPNLATTPCLLYFHENQFAYPEQGARTHLVERQITSLYAALSADQLLFNSAFNRRTFLDGVATLLGRLPDLVPAGLVDRLSARARVLPVPLWSDCFATHVPQSVSATTTGAAAPLAIVWNHRWEYDKGVAALQLLVTALLASGLDFVLHLIGQSFRQIPVPLQQVIADLQQAGRLGECGYIAARADYLALLRRCQVVLSTAEHEFQGIAVLEAVAAGCLPLVPDALAYQDFIPDQWRYADQDQAVQMLLALAAQWQAGALPKAPAQSHLSWHAQLPAWQELLASA
jgi:glycosyltransferase involved in cell wall biosynthesis